MQRGNLLTEAGACRSFGKQSRSSEALSRSSEGVVFVGSFGEAVGEGAEHESQSAPAGGCTTHHSSRLRSEAFVGVRLEDSVFGVQIWIKYTLFGGSKPLIMPLGIASRTIFTDLNAYLLDLFSAIDDQFGFVCQQILL
ncbi:MAG TPA: hypothetical protein VGD58_10410 [Herpetosiphonaceae bacterium]